MPIAQTDLLGNVVLMSTLVEVTCQLSVDDNARALPARILMMTFCIIIIIFFFGFIKDNSRMEVFIYGMAFIHDQS